MCTHVTLLFFISVFGLSPSSAHWYFFNFSSHISHLYVSCVLFNRQFFQLSNVWEIDTNLKFVLAHWMQHFLWWKKCTSFNLVGFLSTIPHSYYMTCNCTHMNVNYMTTVCLTPEMKHCLPKELCVDGMSFMFCFARNKQMIQTPTLTQFSKNIIDLWRFDSRFIWL